MTAVLADVDDVLSRSSYARTVLRPYVRARLGTYLREHGDDPTIAVLLADAARDASLPDLTMDEAAVVFEAWMDDGLDVTTLLTLQGMIAEEGYRAGELTGHVYDDTARALARWHAAGLGTYVFTSGHGPTEKLKFRFSDHGDLAGHIAGWLDETIGPRAAPDAYRLIARAIRRAPDDIIFLSATPAALEAARAAGLRTVFVQRTESPAAGATPACDSRVATLDEVTPDPSTR